MDRGADCGGGWNDHSQSLVVVMDDNESLTTLEVKLVRYINASGKMAFRMVTPTQYNAVELLGLLEAAKFTVYGEMRGGDD